MGTLQLSKQKVQTVFQVTEFSEQWLKKFFSRSGGTIQPPGKKLIQSPTPEGQFLWPSFVQ
jgi:hypothetical protein